MNADITYASRDRRNASTIQHHKEQCMFVQKGKLVEKIKRSLKNVHVWRVVCNFSAVFNNIKVLDVQTIHWCLTTGFQNAGDPVHLRS